VPIALGGFAEPMIVALAREGRTCGQYVSRVDKELAYRADVVPSCLERFDVRLAGGRKHLPLERSSAAVLIGEARRGKERPAASPIPEQPRTHHRSLVAGQVGPRIVVHVDRLLPVAASQQRATPAA
jgi:hypothetical protein